MGFVVLFIVCGGCFICSVFLILLRVNGWVLFV